MRTEDDRETRKLQVVLVVLSRLAFPHLRAAIQVLKCAEGSAAKDWKMTQEKGCPALSFFLVVSPAPTSCQRNWPNKCERRQILATSCCCCRRRALAKMELEVARRRRRMRMILVVRRIMVVRRGGVMLRRRGVYMKEPSRRQFWPRASRSLRRLFGHFFCIVQRVKPQLLHDRRGLFYI